MRSSHAVKLLVFTDSANLTTMGKRKAVIKPKTTPKASRKGGRARKMPVIRNCAKCLERHEAPTGKKCLRLQTPGLQVGAEPLPGPSGLFVPSSSAESVSADEVRLAAPQFPAGSSTDESTPPRGRPLGELCPSTRGCMST